MLNGVSFSCFARFVGVLAKREHESFAPPMRKITSIIIK